MREFAAFISERILTRTPIPPLSFPEIDGNVVAGGFAFDFTPLMIADVKKNIGTERDRIVLKICCRFKWNKTINNLLAFGANRPVEAESRRTALLIDSRARALQCSNDVFYFCFAHFHLVLGFYKIALTALAQFLFNARILLRVESVVFGLVLFHLALMGYTDRNIDLQSIWINETDWIAVDKLKKIHAVRI